MCRRPECREAFVGRPEFGLPERQRGSVRRRSGSADAPKISLVKRSEEQSTAREDLQGRRRTAATSISSSAKRIGCRHSESASEHRLLSSRQARGHRMTGALQATRRRRKGENRSRDGEPMIGGVAREQALRVRCRTCNGQSSSRAVAFLQRTAENPRCVEHRRV